MREETACWSGRVVGRLDESHGFECKRSSSCSAACQIIFLQDKALMSNPEL